MNKFERLLLVSFFGNYVINTIVAALVALIPPSPDGGIFTAQYITFVVLAVIVAALFTRWFLKGFMGPGVLKRAVLFGVGAFVIAIATTFISGTANVLMQSGSFSQVIAVIPNFGPFLWNWTTLVLLGYWVIPAAVVGWLASRKMSAAM